MRIVREYADEGRSGLDLARRPGLRQFLQDAVSDTPGFEALLVYDISRWGRFQDTDESAYYEHLCKRAGIQVIYCAEPFENDGSALTGIMKAIKRVMAAEYSAELSRKVLYGQLRMASRGFAQGGRPSIGLRRLLVDEAGAPRQILQPGEEKAVHTDRVILVPGPQAEIDLVIRIFKLFTEDHQSEERIAKRLNAEGISSPSGTGRWWGPQVSLILRNERYVGNYLFNRRSSRLRSAKRANDESTWIKCMAVFEPIIDASLFEAAAAKFAARTRALPDDELLSRLRRLFEREGRLSSSLIDDDPEMPSASVYRHRFGSLVAAYRRVGFNAYVVQEGPRRASGYLYEKEWLLDRLQDLQRRKGVVTSAVVDADPSTPSRRAFERAFGSLAKAILLLESHRNSAGAMETAATTELQTPDGPP
jgi:DNA invertase Pin-like site-specific DNA recombinase